MDSLGDRMKRYEESWHGALTPRMPAIVRVDGKAFHTYTRGFDRPFDARLNGAMLDAAQATASEMQGFKVGYHQSDEVSFLLTDYETITTEGWFGYDQQKLASVTASMMTAYFNASIQGYAPAKHPATFDGRAFNIPREDVTNYFVWRAKDWARNSLQMYARSFFSPKQLHGAGREQMHEMLHGIGKNWTTDLDEVWRNGSMILPDAVLHPLPSYADLSQIIEPLVNCDAPKPE